MTTFLKYLRLFFYVFVVATIGLYCADRFEAWHNTWWLYCGLTTVGLSILRFVLNKL